MYLCLSNKIWMQLFLCCLEKTQLKVMQILEIGSTMKISTCDNATKLLQHTSKEIDFARQFPRLFARFCVSFQCKFASQWQSEKYVARKEQDSTRGIGISSRRHFSSLLCGIAFASDFSLLVTPKGQKVAGGRLNGTRGETDFLSRAHRVSCAAHSLSISLKCNNQSQRAAQRIEPRTREQRKQQLNCQ